MRRQKVSATWVWLALIVGTGLAWLLGHHRTDGQAIRLEPELVAGILIVAFAKVSLVMAYFMELRWAPFAVSAVAAIWVLLEGGLLIWLFTR